MTTAPSPWVIARAAIRPQTLPAAAAPVVVGAALAMAHGAKHMLVTLAALFGALSFKFLRICTTTWLISGEAPIPKTGWVQIGSPKKAG